MSTYNKSKQQPRPWWDELLPHVGGDVIVGKVGAGAKNVAVGKNIQQTIDSILGPTTPDDKKIIEKNLGAVSAELAQERQKLDAQIATMAEFQIKLLGDELKKTGKNETPSASTITQVGDWLLKNVPSIAGAIAGLFTSPAVGKVIGKAGEAAIQWAKERFGHAGS